MSLERDGCGGRGDSGGGVDRRAPRVADVSGGPGWVLDGATLDPVVTDLAAFREGTVGDPLGTVIEALWTGRHDEARRALADHPPSVRTAALLADCDRLSGRPDQAVRKLRALVQDHEGTAWEPVLRQHLGKALLAGGDLAAARSQFESALALRLERGAPTDQVASSRQALTLAELRAGRG